jgi:hypothetical protein
MKVKTSELKERALDWAVAQTKGRIWEAVKSFIAYHEDGEMNYSTNWAQGGPIIEREGIGFFPSEREGKPRWGARMVNTYISYGPTPLIAAMRCYVASKLGDEIDIPEELK